MPRPPGRVNASRAARATRLGTDQGAGRRKGEFHHISIHPLLRPRVTRAKLGAETGAQRMDVLFVNNNFPGQYRHIARSLHEAGGCRLFAIGTKTAQGMPEVSMARYAVAPGQDAAAVHPFARRFDTEMRRAEAVIDASLKLKSLGFDPQVALVSSGLGRERPAPQPFPRARIIPYCEFFYGGADSDVGFDPESPTRRRRIGAGWRPGTRPR